MAFKICNDHQVFMTALIDLIAEQTTQVVSIPFYMMIGRITRTVSICNYVIIKYVLLISEIGSCVRHVYCLDI